MELLSQKSEGSLRLPDSDTASGESEKIYIIPPNRTRYLSEISENNRKYDEKAGKQSEIARNLFALHQSVLHLGGPRLLDNPAAGSEHPIAAVKALSESISVPAQGSGPAPLRSDQKLGAEARPILR
jgi:hypothetical protein